MSAGGFRVWDLCELSDAWLFLAPEGLGTRARELPLPCRALRLPFGAADPRLRPWRQVLPPSLTLLAGERASVLAGPTADLLRASETAPAGVGPPMEESLQRYEAPPPPLRFADGECWDLRERVRVMGILNVTPDSFSDGGRYPSAEAAAKSARQMVAEGADLIDVGGESTRPGAAPVSVEEEIRRVVPVIGLLRRSLPELRVSVDTRRSATARRALEAGADMINDVSALSDPEMAGLAAQARCPLVLMHMRGTPRTMQRDTRYSNLLQEIIDHLQEKLRAAENAGVEGDRLIVDPGLGFGKPVEGNEEILRQLGSFRALGRAILVGASRKTFIGKRTGVDRPAGREAGSLAAASAAVLAGARILRVHDVEATRECLDLTDALRRWPAPAGAPGRTDPAGSR